MHVGTFTPEGTFAAAAARLPALLALGVTAIELMPVAEFPGRRNWGYDGVHLYAPHHDYGGPEGLKQLVDAAHTLGLGVVLDVVYNHVGPEGNYLDRYGPYFTEIYRTPWGRAGAVDHEAVADEDVDVPDQAGSQPARCRTSLATVVTSRSSVSTSTSSMCRASICAASSTARLRCHSMSRQGPRRRTRA